MTNGSQKILIVISSAVSCPSFLKALIFPATFNQILRGATTMHEIPNFPYPSLKEPEQSTAQQEPGEQTELKASPTKTENSHSAKRED